MTDTEYIENSAENNIDNSFDNNIDSSADNNIDTGAENDIQTEEAPKRGFDTFTSEELFDYRFEKRDFIVRNLLRPGLAVLAGSPKIGKSWMVLYLCLQAAKGEDFLNNKVKPSEVLYMALEDDPARLQNRLMTLTDEPTARLHITTSCVGKSLSEDICAFEREHPRCRLIVIDTFQKIRKAGREMSYSNDYSDVSRLKKLADKLGICILLVHHTRKMPDNDCMNEISGTNGIAGSADTLMVLKKEKRTSRSAVLFCTGRDIEDRELTLYLDRDTCVWQVKSDTLEEQDESLPEELVELAEFMKERGEFAGTATELCDAFCSARSYIIAPNQLTRSMNQHRLELKEAGVEFVSKRERDKRMIGVVYTGVSAESADTRQKERIAVPPAPAEADEARRIQPRRSAENRESEACREDIGDSAVRAESEARQIHLGQTSCYGEARDPEPLTARTAPADDAASSAAEDSALYRDDDYMRSLLGDSGYFPDPDGDSMYDPEADEDVCSLLSDIDLEEERSLWN